MYLWGGRDEDLGVVKVPASEARHGHDDEGENLQDCGHIRNFDNFFKSLLVLTNCATLQATTELRLAMSEAILSQSCLRPSQTDKARTQIGHVMKDLEGKLWHCTLHKHCWLSKLRTFH